MAPMCTTKPMAVKWHYFLLMTIFLSLSISACTAKSNAQQHPTFKSNVRSIPNRIQLQMNKSTWRKGCPVSVDNLAYVELSYWGFMKKHIWELSM